MTKRTVLLFFLTLLLTAGLRAADITARLQGLTQVVRVDTLAQTADYDSKYCVRFNQPLDHLHPMLGSFNQRVVVMHRGFDRPTMIITEGYDASYALRPQYCEEISKWFNTNVIFVEHRFFSESTPQPCQWQYLTDHNAMADLHEVVKAFKGLYPGKWIASGISKGGQTCMEFRALYPGDVEISVPYVAPLCFKVEDGRHEPFLRNKIGTAAERQTILDFQRDALGRKRRLMPAFQTFCTEKGLSFRVPVEDVFDFCVLEYSFAHWQWGTPVSGIPTRTSADSTILNELLAVSGPDYFTPNALPSFFYQAARELGYYGYDTKPFKGLVGMKSAKGYLHRVMLPDSLESVKFDKGITRYTRRFLKRNDVPMIFIYGENDPWTAAGVTWLKNKKQMHVFIQPRGSHRSRINNMPQDLKQQILDLLAKWLGEKPKTDALQKAA